MEPPAPERKRQWPVIDLTMEEEQPTVCSKRSRPAAGCDDVEVVIEPMFLGKPGPPDGVYRQLARNLDRQHGFPRVWYAGRPYNTVDEARAVRQAWLVAQPGTL
jgi:hypothetical protein